MKGMRRNFLRKLKLIPTKTNSKQSLVLQLNTQDMFCIQKCPTSPFLDDNKGNDLRLTSVQFGTGINLSDLEFSKSFDQSENDDDDVDDDHFEEQEFNFKLATTKQVACIKEYPSLKDFEEKCPPGGSNSIILYTTSLRGIRKTFQDCNTIHFLLRSFRIMYHERDVSLHLKYREEMWNILGEKVIPPKLFIKGRYIGGADEVIGLHEMGWLGKILEGTPTVSSDCLCIGCANMGFTICSTCCGSCKVFINNDDNNNNNECFLRCHDCNENGLVKCPICC
jgi:glutaredoxin domain-containing cysteine-rich protein 1